MVVGGVRALRATSRAAGIARLHSELDALSRAPMARAMHSEELRDIVRAHSAARGVERRWSTAVATGTNPDAAIAPALRRIAVSESAEAFNAGRSIYLGADTAFVRVWDAQIDACPRCWTLEGTTVPAGESFPMGEPGTIHPNCRCEWYLEPASLH